MAFYQAVFRQSYQNLFVTEVKDRGAKLFQPDGVIQWTANEVEFYTNVLEDSKNVIQKLASFAGVRKYGIPWAFLCISLNKSIKNLPC